MRLIDANELAKEFDDIGQDIDVLDVLLIIERQKSIDAVPVVHGEWIRHGCDEEEFEYYECPLCGFIGLKYNYCPNCGAKMDAKEGTEE